MYVREAAAARLAAMSGGGHEVAHPQPGGDASSRTTR